jgi:4-alpha-glucanotransferase
LADLKHLAMWSANQGAGAVLINPLGAAAPVQPQQASPYFPASRRFKNPLYLSIDHVPGATQQGNALPALAAEARALNQERRIDRDRVYRLKMHALESLWQRWPGNEDFEGYCRQQGEDLVKYATYCVLAETHGGDWRHWPAEFQSPNSSAVVSRANEFAERIRFHMWLQWLLDCQLANAAKAAPLVQDLPIGVDPGGADAWQWQDVLATNATVGAPPDQFNAHGQNWALPPFIPHRLRAARYEPFIQTIRASLGHAGGLRIDHVMGLFRLYWIPAGHGPEGGAYVRYPADELLAVVAIESHRAGAWIAGEDLGTVEPHVRHCLHENQMLCYRLMWFEDASPREYPALSMAAITTHDLPTVAGLWSGADFEDQQRIGLNPSDEGYQQLRSRLQQATGLSEDEPVEQAIRRAYRAMQAAPSAVLVANLEDTAAVPQRPNMPGTIDQWPNWSLALPQSLEEIQDAPLARDIALSLERSS